MNKTICYIRGYASDIQLLLDNSNTKLIAYSKGVYTIELYLPTTIINHENGYKFHLLKTARGLYRKLKRYKLLNTIQQERIRYDYTKNNCMQ